jgi:hypothetical protein
MPTHHTVVLSNPARLAANSVCRFARQPRYLSPQGGGNLSLANRKRSQATATIICESVQTHLAVALPLLFVRHRTKCAPISVKSCSIQFQSGSGTSELQRPADKFRSFGIQTTSFGVSEWSPSSGALHFLRSRLKCVVLMKRGGVARPPRRSAYLPPNSRSVARDAGRRSER